jgi:hypothetical protein
MSILEWFCDVDDFWQAYGAQWERTLIETKVRQRHRERDMAPSEIMTILIHFHQSCYRTFKH